MASSAAGTGRAGRRVASGGRRVVARPGSGWSEEPVPGVQAGRAGDRVVPLLPSRALRALKRQISNAIFACLQADASRARGPGGQQGNGSVASAAGSHPRHRLFGQATPGPGHHPTATSGDPPSRPAHGRGRAGHSPIAAKLPPAQPQVQVERPQRSQDERPGGAARRRPHPAARKASGQGPPVKPQRPKTISHPAKKTDGTP